MDLEILYIDNHIVVAVKPPNVLSQGDISGDEDILTAIKNYVGIKFNKAGNVYIGLVHRLDRPAGGVMVFARTSKAASRLSAQFAEHSQGRRYFAVLDGNIATGTRMVDWLYKGSDGNVRAVSEGYSGAKRAELFSEPICHSNGLTLADVELFTGRAHQIRVQHASRELPLWGDNRYGRGRPGQQLALWAYSLTFTHPTLKTDMTFVKAPPNSGVWAQFSASIAERTTDEKNR